MSTAEVPRDASAVDMKLEVVIIPVDDVDRAKKFYEGLGWRLDADLGGGDLRIVQLTPPGSGCSVQFGSGLTTAAPGSAENLLVVADIEAAHAAIVDHGAEAGEVFHDGSGGYNRFDPGVRARGPDPERRTYASFMEFRDPDGNVWQLQEITNRLPGRVDSGVATFTSVDELARALRRAEAAHGEHEARTGERDEDWPTWYATFMLAEQTGDELPVLSDYDVIVLGAGAPGEHCAGALADGGLRVAVVERELVGGECSYWGCIPSKTLLRPGEAAHEANEAAVHAAVDVDAALAWRDFMVSNHTDSSAAMWLTDHGIDLLRGDGRLAGPGIVEVAGERHTARHVVLANGAEPIIPPIPGLRELAGVWTNREVTGMTAVPRRLVILGGGPVGVEMAQAVRRLGGEVVLVDVAERVLPNEPAPLGDALGEVLRRDGIELVLGASAQRAWRDGTEYVLDVDGAPAVRGDHLLVATGRRPRVEGIGLETIGVTPDPHGIPVDDRLRVADGIWAIGDVTGIWPLTTTGKYQGDIVAANILGDDRVANYEALPRVVFTDPHAAAVGEIDARFRGTAPVSGVAKTATYTRAYAESNGFLTVLSDGDRLTGAYALGPEAGEWIQQATLAIRARVPLDVLYDTIQPFPTFSEIYADALKVLRADIAGAPGVTVLMIVAGVVLIAVVVGAIWYVVVRGRDGDLVSRRDFDATYDGDAESAYEDFHAWQVRTEAERRSWEDPDDG